MPGVRCERIIRPIDRVGLYVPAGSAPLPSTVIMLAVPARIAGCASRAIAQPPGPDGKVHAGGARRRASCAASTRCSRWAARRPSRPSPTARRAFPRSTRSSAPATRGSRPPSSSSPPIRPARPSTCPRDLPKSWSIADDSANARFVAADLLAQAEHDTHRAGHAGHHVAALAADVAAELAAQTRDAVAAARSSRSRWPAAAASSCPISRRPSRSRTTTRPST